MVGQGGRAKIFELLVLAVELLDTRDVHRITKDDPLGQLGFRPREYGQGQRSPTDEQHFRMPNVVVRSVRQMYAKRQERSLSQLRVDFSTLHSVSDRSA